MRKKKKSRRNMFSNITSCAYPDTNNKTMKTDVSSSLTYFQYLLHFSFSLSMYFFLFFFKSYFRILYVKDDVIIKIKRVRVSYIKLSKYATEKPGCFDDATSTNGERYILVHSVSV